MPRTPKSILIALILWAIIFAGIAAIVRFLILPVFEEKRQAALMDQTGSRGRYKHEIKLAVDNFSGYCLLRSPELASDLKQDAIKLTLIDDGANYTKRTEALKKGAVDMAVFPINSFLQTGAQLGSFPASIAYIIDETQGADAIIAHKSQIKNIQDLNRKDARIVATSDSPSEFLSRVLTASFHLPEFPESGWLIEAEGSTAAYERFRSEGDSNAHAYALWEPHVSRAKRDKNTVVLIDSSKLRGYIVDVLVIRRELLIKHYNLAKTFIEYYARTVYKNKDDMVSVVIEDSKRLGGDLSQDDARNIVDGIAWKNTLENRAHFGLLDNQSSQETIEDSILKIIDVLVKTGALTKDPTQGKIRSLYFDQILKDMEAENFHPGRRLTIIEGIDPGKSDERLQAVDTLPALNPAQWDSLLPVGELRIQPIQFGRGTDRLTLQGKRDVKALAKTLESWPGYYLVITGRARQGGDESAALELAQRRADATLTVLIENGISRHRLKTKAVIDTSDSPEAQTVSFLVGQLPY